MEFCRQPVGVTLAFSAPTVRRMIGSTSVIGARRSTTTDTVTRVPL